MGQIHEDLSGGKSLYLLPCWEKKMIKLPVGLRMKILQWQTEARGCVGLLWDLTGVEWSSWQWSWTLWFLSLAIPPLNGGAIVCWLGAQTAQVPHLHHPASQTRHEPKPPFPHVWTCHSDSSHGEVYVQISDFVKHLAHCPAWRLCGRCLCYQFYFIITILGFLSVSVLEEVVPALRTLDSWVTQCFSWASFLRSSSEQRHQDSWELLQTQTASYAVHFLLYPPGSCLHCSWGESDAWNITAQTRGWALVHWLSLRGAPVPRCPFLEISSCRYTLFRRSIQMHISHTSFWDKITRPRMTCTLWVSCANTGLEQLREAWCTRLPWVSLEAVSDHLLLLTSQQCHSPCPMWNDSHSGFQSVLAPGCVLSKAECRGRWPGGRGVSAFPSLTSKEPYHTLRWRPERGRF